jgi:peptidoglycan hydrolase CwlO-like protein
MCYQGRGVSGALDYLVCLHNEQNQDLEDQSRIINNHARLIDAATANISSLQSEVADLIHQLNDQKTEVVRLKLRIEELERAAQPGN